MKAPTWLAAAAAALTLAVSAGVSAPAASAASRDACPWQPLTLVNGWQSANAQFGGTGDPSYCVENGIVYLSGSLYQPTPGAETFANLPFGDFPTSILYLPVYTFAGTTANLTISAGGSMSLWNASGQPNTESEYTSLAGISFPEAGTPLSLIPVTNQWQSANAQFGTGDPSYVVRSGIVYLTGSAFTLFPNELFTWPVAAFGPHACITTNVYTFDGTLGRAFIQPPGGGAMWFINDQPGYANATFTSLANIAYPAIGAVWQPLTLQNGWTTDATDCDSGVPSYNISNGVVYLSGAVIHSQSGSGPVATLPPSAWPSHYLYFSINTFHGHASLEISPTGQLTVFDSSTKPDGTADGTSLGNISYQAGS